MSMTVYPFPPVTVQGQSWTRQFPVETSRLMGSGAFAISTSQSERRRVSFEVGGIGSNRMGAGYMEVLKRKLGGVSAVRLYSYPVNFWLDAVKDRGTRDDDPLFWTSGGSHLGWGGMLWFSGTIVTGTTSQDSSGQWLLTIAGDSVLSPLSPGRLIARPGEFVALYEAEAETPSETETVHRAQVQTAAYVQSDGTAIIKLMDEVPLLTDVRVDVGAADTGVFFPIGEYPSAMQTVNGVSSWSYTWEFLEIFEDEVFGGFTELTDTWDDA